MTKRTKAIAYTRGTCPRCGRTERVVILDGTSSVDIHVLPGGGALIECGGVGMEPKQ
jgi:hypothetical protein